MTFTHVATPRYQFEAQLEEAQEFRS